MTLTISVQCSSVQSLSHVWLFVTPWTAAHQASLSITISGSLLKLLSIQVDDAIQLSYPLLPTSALNLSQHEGLFRWVSSSHQVAKILEFQLQYQSLHEHPGLISSRMDWLDLLTVQRPLNSLLQHHSSKASILLHSVLLMVQLSHPYMTTGKTIALTRRTFVGKVMSLVLNML